MSGFEIRLSLLRKRRLTLIERGIQEPRGQEACTQAQTWSAFCAKSAHGIDDQADHQNKSQPAAADGGSAKVKTTATE